MPPTDPAKSVPNTTAGLGSPSPHPGVSPAAAAALNDGTEDPTNLDSPSAPIAKPAPEKSDAAATEYAPPHMAGIAPGVSPSAAAALSDGTEDPTLSEDPPTSTTTTTPSRPIVFSGPSGTGKSTLLKKLFAAHPSHFGFSVSHTTRSPRPGEIDGVHYHFTTPDTFQSMIHNHEFEEHAKFGGNYYGSSRAAVQAVAQGRGKDMDGNEASGNRICVFDIEMEGVKQLKQSALNPRICFIQPPDVDTLEERLRGRGTDSEDAIQKRLAQAKNEIEYCRTEGRGDKVVVNDDLDRAFRDLDEWVMKDLTSQN